MQSTRGRRLDHGNYFTGFGLDNVYVTDGPYSHTFTTESCSGMENGDDTQLGEVLYFVLMLLTLYGTPTTLAAMLWD